MRGSRIAWIVLAALYAGFLFWYDGGGGPLSPLEIERHIVSLEARGIPPQRLSNLRAFLESDPGGDFVIANYLHLRENSQQALDRYMKHMYPALFRRACHPVFAGTVLAGALDLWGVENADRWDLVGLVRYRSRRDMIEIATDPAFAGAHPYKNEALEQTIAVPVGPFLMLGSPRVLLALVLVALGALLQLALGRRAG